MSLTPDDLARIRIEVERFRHEKNLCGFPVDLDRAYQAADLAAPQPLYREHLEEGYLAFEVPHEGFSWRDDGFRGAFDIATRQVSINDSMSSRRRRLALAHELMHDQLKHVDFLASSLYTPLMLDEIEEEATAAALQLLAPADDFATAVLQATPAGGRTGWAQIQTVADRYDITLFTAGRRHVETTTQPAALIMLRPPRNYQGETPRDLWLRGWTSQAWRNNGHPDVPTQEPLRVTDDSLAVSGFALLRVDRSEFHGPAQRLLEQVERRFGARGDIYRSGGSINIVLTEPL